jgi:multimeric flavodoxin WrbA
MTQKIDRRKLIGTAGAAMALGAMGVNASGEEAKRTRKIVGVSCSPRKGKTTAAALQVCLEAAKEEDPQLQVELVELADLSIPGYMAAGVSLKPGDKDDFPMLVEKLGDPAVVGIIVGSPVYFGNMSALCKAFLDRCVAFRRAGFKLSNKVAGVLAVGGARNGGQELTIRSIQTALMAQDMIVVGDGQPSARIGATFWNQNDSIADDAFGVGTAKNLGRRVVQVASKLAP